MPSGRAYPFADTRSYGKASLEVNGSLGEALKVEDLLDFSEDGKADNLEEVHHSVGSSTNSQITDKTSSDSFSPVEEGKPQSLSSLEADELSFLCVPSDDLADLEWLYNGAEESYFYGDVATTVFGSCSNTSISEDENKRSQQQIYNASRVPVVESRSCSTVKPVGFLREVAVKPRSKRSRTGVSFWNTRILYTEAPSNTFESSSTSSVVKLAAVAPLIFEERDAGADSIPSTKKLCKATNNHHIKSKKAVQEASQPRRCLHCGIQKTPQWRAGPMGPKTLCNACGVRYRSGRLLPEYRPAASPTFVESIHSNSHRRVLDLHRQRVSQEFMRSHATQLPQQKQMQIRLDYGDDCLLFKETAEDMLGVMVV